MFSKLSRENQEEEEEAEEEGIKHPTTIWNKKKYSSARIRRKC